MHGQLMRRGLYAGHKALGHIKGGYGHVSPVQAPSRICARRIWAWTCEATQLLPHSKAYLTADLKPERWQASGTLPDAPAPVVM